MMYKSKIENIKPEPQPNDAVKADGLPSAQVAQNPMLAAVLNWFFIVLFVISLIAWLVCVFTGNVTEMWISNLLMWVGVFGIKLYPNCS